MIEMMKLQYRYIFNRMTIIIVVIFNLLLIIGLVYSSSISEGYFYIDSYRKSYMESYNTESFLLIKVASVMISVILTTIIYSDASNNLCKYLVDKAEKKFVIYFSRLLTVLLVMIFTITVYFLDYLLIAIIFTPYIIDIVSIGKIAFWIILQVFTYIAITAFLTTLVPNILLSLIPIALFWFLEINAQEEVILQLDILRLMYEYIPNVIEINGKYTVTGTIGKYLVFFLFVISGNCLYFVKKDII